MTSRQVMFAAAALVLIGGLAFGVNQLLGRLARPEPVAPSIPPPPPAPTAHITATLFYGSEDGQALVPVRREVPLAEGVVAQGRQILAEQLKAPPGPYVAVIPPGTTLRAFYVTERGDAFVDLSAQVSSAHPGGSFTELLTVYALVNAVTANLSSVKRVQLLVEGKEVDTIAGHVDVRRPLQRDSTLVREESR